MKKYLHAVSAHPPLFGRMRAEHVTPCKIFGDDGSVVAEYASPAAAVADGWLVD